MALSHKDFKETVTRPFHIQNRAPTDEYRDGWDRIWGRQKFKTLPSEESPPTVSDEEKNS